MGQSNKSPDRSDAPYSKKQQHSTPLAKLASRPALFEWLWLLCSPAQYGGHLCTITLALYRLCARRDHWQCTWQQRYSPESQNGTKLVHGFIRHLIVRKTLTLSILLLIHCKYTARNPCFTLKAVHTAQNRSSPIQQRPVSPPPLVFTLTTSLSQTCPFAKYCISNTQSPAYSCSKWREQAEKANRFVGSVWTTENDEGVTHVTMIRCRMT